MDTSHFIEEPKRRRLQSKLIDFYLRNGRRFPWRQTKDPFKILVAEILLKRTGAWKAEAVYNTVVQNFGSVILMSKADISELRELIRPLGLIHRAELLVRISRDMVNHFDGRVPENFDELTTLKGVGRYIANAILCLAHEKRVPLVDESVRRVFMRSLNVQSTKRAYMDEELWQLAHDLLPEHNVKEYNLGLLDLGAIICKHKNPSCHRCPLAPSICIGLE